MTPENLVIIALFFAASAGIALVGFVLEKSGLDTAVVRWFERRLR